MAITIISSSSGIDWLADLDSVTLTSSGTGDQLFVYHFYGRDSSGNPERTLTTNTLGSVTTTIADSQVTNVGTQKAYVGNHYILDSNLVYDLPQVLDITWSTGLTIDSVGGFFHLEGVDQNSPSVVQTGVSNGYIVNDATDLTYNGSAGDIAIYMLNLNAGPFVTPAGWIELCVNDANSNGDDAQIDDGRIYYRILDQDENNTTITYAGPGVVRGWQSVRVYKAAAAPTGLDILPTGISSTLSFGTTSLTIDNGLDISPIGISSTLSFGTTSLTIDTELDISPTGISSTLSFGNNIVVGGQTINITASGISSTLSFGLAALDTAENNISVSSISSTLSFGNPTVSNLANEIDVTGISSTLNFGNASLTIDDDLNILASGISSTLSFGNTNISLVGLDISTTGISSTLNFGTTTLDTGVEGINANSIPSTLIFGNTTISIQTELDITASGISSTLSFGNPSLTSGAELDITASGISSTISFGTTEIILENELDISVSGISSTLNFGNTTIYNVKIVNVVPTSISSTLTFGDAQVLNQIIVVIVVSAPEQRTFKIESENRVLDVELENRTFNIELEDRIFIVKAGDKKVKEINKDPQATLNYSFDINNWIEADDSFSSYSITVSSGLTLESDGELDNIITGVVSGGADQGTESIVCTFNTTNGYSDQRTILLNMGNR